MRLNAFWVPCTPEWVAKWQCGSTVRRPVLEPCELEDPGHFHAIGHEHLMCLPGLSPFAVPVDHRSGEPA